MLGQSAGERLYTLVKHLLHSFNGRQVRAGFVDAGDHQRLKRGDSTIMTMRCPTFLSCCLMLSKLTELSDAMLTRPTRTLGLIHRGRSRAMLRPE